MINFRDTRTLLDSTSTILKHKKEKEKLKGERFNIFSILKMEHKENATHTAFLCELLDPKGSHLMGSVFLEFFLDILFDESGKKLEVSLVKIRPEFYIGPVNFEKQTGGQIDIILKDRNGNSVSIENKIYAPDQKAQIKRYCNYNRNKNTVYYLTLHGHHPKDSSKVDMIANEGFYVISYKNHIKNWLLACAKEAADEPILRETIKQYIILIQKLTHTMDKTEEKQLLELIIKNYDQAAYIHAKFTNARYHVAQEIKKAVFEKLNTSLNDEFIIKSVGEVKNKWSKIKIFPKGYENKPLFFNIEDFSGDGHANSILFICIINRDRKDIRLINEEEADQIRSGIHINLVRFSDYGEYPVDPNNSQVITKFHTDRAFQEGFTKHIVNESKAYIERHLETLKRTLDSLELDEQ